MNGSALGMPKRRTSAVKYFNPVSILPWSGIRPGPESTFPVHRYTWATVKVGYKREDIR